MTKKEILNGNKLILKFMGFKFCNDDKSYFPKGYYFIDAEDEGRFITTISDCNYEESFDSIIPVVYKCCKIISEQGFIGNTIDELNAKQVYTTHLNNSIESVWKCII